MSTIVKNPTPKARFQTSVDNVSKHRDLIQTEEFERAVDFALLHYQSTLCVEPGDLNQCAARHLRMQGALEFVMILRNLGESTAPIPSKQLIGNLDHKA